MTASKLRPSPARRCSPFAAAAPAFAQKLSLAERVTRAGTAGASQSSAAGQARLELLNRMAQMQAEVQALRNQVEHAAERERPAQAAGPRPVRGPRHAACSGWKAGAAPAAGNERPWRRCPTGGDAAARRSDASDRQRTGPACLARRPVPAPAGGEQGLTHAAFAALKQRRLRRVRARFQAYLRDYPDGRWRPTPGTGWARATTSTQNYPLALQAFDTVLRTSRIRPRHPTRCSSRATARSSWARRGAGAATLNARHQRVPRHAKPRAWPMSRLRSAQPADPR